MMLSQRPRDKGLSNAYFRYGAQALVAPNTSAMSHRAEPMNVEEESSENELDFIMEEGPKPKIVREYMREFFDNIKSKEEMTARKYRGGQ